MPASLESAQARASQYAENNKLVDRRLQTMETSLAAIFDATTRFRTLLVNALNLNNGPELAISSEAANFKQEIANLRALIVELRPAALD